MNVIEAYKQAIFGQAILNTEYRTRFVKIEEPYGSNYKNFQHFVGKLDYKYFISNDWVIINETQPVKRSHKLNKHADVDLHFALQVFSGRINLRQLQDEPAAEIFNKLSCTEEMQAIAEDVIYQRLKCGVE